MQFTSDIGIQEKLKRWANVLSGLVGVIATLVLTGWLFNIRFLKSPGPDIVSTNPASAIAFFLSCISYFLLVSTESRQKKFIARVFAFIVFLIGFLTLVSIIIKSGFSVDQILFHNKLKKEIVDGRANQMAPNTAFCVALLGLSLLLMNRRTKRKQWLTPVVPASTIAALAFLSALGYLYRVDAFYGILTYIPMAFYSAFCFLFFSIAILFSNPEIGFMKEFTKEYTGSFIARLWVPVAIIIPVVLGLLRLWGAWSGVLPFELGTSLLVLSIIAFFLFFIWYNASLLNKRDAKNKLIERTLVESEEQIQAIFNAAPDAVIVIDEGGVIQKWNPKAEDLFGWKAEEVTGKLISDIIIPHRYREAHKAGMKRFLKTGESTVLHNQIEIQALNKNHDEFEIALSISPTIINKKYLFIGFIRDITEQKKAEEEVNASNKRFTAIFNISPVAISINDAENESFMYVNDAFCTITGLKRDEVIGKTSVELNIVPAEPPHKTATQAHQVGKTKGSEIKIRKANGELINIINSIEKIEIDNKPCWVSTFIDITERTRAEEKFKGLLEAAPDAMIITNEKGEIVLINHQTEILFGYERKELMGKAIETLIPAEFSSRHIEHRTRYFKNPKVRSMGAGLELFALRKNGTQFPVEVSLSPLATEEGTFISASVRDITDRKKAEEKFRGLLESAPDAIVIANENGVIVLINQQTEKLFGYKRDELIGKPVEALLPLGFRDKHVQHRTNYFSDPKVRSMGAGLELFAQRKDGTQFPVEISLSPLETAEGTLVSAAVRDITDRKKAQAQIQKQKQEIQDFIDSMSTLCAKVTIDGQLLMVNKIVMQASGLDMKELLSTNFLEGQWWTFDKNVHARVNDAFNKAKKGTPINYDENIFVFGQVLTINFSLTPIFENGTVDYIVAEGRDITAQKKAEEKIKESEEKLSILFNSIDEGFCIIQMIFDERKKPIDYRFLVVNPSFEKQTGLRDAVGKRMREFAPDHEEHWFEIYGKIALTGESIRFENRAEQLHRWYDVYAFRFGDPENMQVAILFNDITNRKQTEEEIRQLNAELEKRVEEKTREIIQNEKRFRTLIENSTDIISLANENFKTVYTSPSAERITGWSRDERETMGYIEQTHPEDMETMKGVLKNILVYPGKPVAVMYRARHKEGHYIWLEGVMTNMLHDDSIKAVVANLRDVTETKKAQDLLKASENRFRSIIEQFPYPVVTYDPTGDYTAANAAWEVMWQFKREDVKEYNIRKDPQMISSGLSLYVEKAFAGSVATSEPYLYDPAVIGYDSRKRWMQMTLYPLKNDDGEILEVILILLDVTNNKEAEEKIKNLNESLERKVAERTAQLETVNIELESFSYSVSHDLRAPLRIIDGYSDLLVGDYSKVLDDEGKRMLGIIINNARKMGQLIDDLLNLSRLGKKELIVQKVDMNRLVKSVIDELPEKDEIAPNIKVATLFPVVCDSNLVRQAWVNLISNAVKYSSTKENPLIEIDSHKDGNEIVYSIKDNGVGFDIAYADKLFGVFQRLHKASEFEGTGVGLALVKRIITRHGGKVWAMSEVNKGATFFFSLPAESAGLTELSTSL